MSGRVFNVSSIEIPSGWIDTAPVLCHQPLDYLTKQVVCDRVRAPTSTLKFEAFSDRWTVMIGNMFGIVLDPGSHIGGVWSLSIPEGMKEVLWKEMNSTLVLGHRYFGTRNAKSDMGRFCPCDAEMTLSHILLGCSAYKLQPLMDVLLDVLGSFSLAHGFKTLHPDAWGVSPWYPLLALKELEETAFLIVKGRKKLLKSLWVSRQRREWVIGNYYWALWKWCMKEIHDAKFKFVPCFCKEALREILITPVPHHMLKCDNGENAGSADAARRASTPVPTPPAGNSALLPPPISHLLAHGAESCLTGRGKSILRVLRAPATTGSSQTLTSRERILRALTDDAYT